MLSATAATGLFFGSKLVINILVLSETIFPFHLLGLKGLIEVIAIFLEFDNDDDLSNAYAVYNYDSNKDYIDFFVTNLSQIIQKQLMK